MKRRLLFSIAFLISILATVVGGTGAFFSDIETSAGNTMAAGGIDLQIDNESYFNGEFREDLSWEQKDLEDELFFNYADLRPGDEGEDTISIHTGMNNAWVCMDIGLTAVDDNGLTDAESEVDATGGDGEGELQEFINFVWWPDDGDNVLEDDEANDAVFTGTLADMDGESIAFADTSGNAILGDTPVQGSSTVYIGKAWCFGELTLDPLTQDGGDQGRNPADDGSGTACNGAGVGNLSQTDSILGTIEFRAMQSRHNPDFICESELLPFARTGTTSTTTEALMDDIDEEDDQATTTASTTMAILTVDANHPLSTTTEPTIEDFTFILDNGTTTKVFDEIPTLLPPGEYILTQTYIGSSTLQFETSFSGACLQSGTSSSATLDLLPGDDVTCWILNAET